MGIRGELFSTRLILPNRTYFLNIKENRMGDLYLNIVESKNKETGGFERQSVIIFADDLPSFLGEFDKALRALESAVREQKRSGGKRGEDRENPDNAEGKDRYGKGRRAAWEDTGKETPRPERGRPERSSRPGGKYRENREDREGGTGYKRSRPERDDRSSGKRVVVKRNREK